MSNIKIQGNKIKVLDSIWKNDQIKMIIILAILRFSINGKTLSVNLRLLSYLLNVIRKNTSLSRFSILLSDPWHVDEDLRKKILMATELNLIDVLEKDNKVLLKLTEKGILEIDAIISKGVMKGFFSKINNYCIKVNNKELDKQHLSW